MSEVMGRPEIYREAVSIASLGVVEKPLTSVERLYNQGWLRKLVLVLILAAAWEIYARSLNNDLLLPTFSETCIALVNGMLHGDMLSSVWTSLQTLLSGFCIGIILALVLTVAAVSTRLGTDFLETMTAMLNPLPAIALLPLSLIWFGIGSASIIFVLVHSVLWPVALNTHSGFSSVSTTMRMVGRNYGLTGFRLVARILVPAAFPSILAGLKIGWAFAWRTLIAAELVFGVSTGSGGIGWYIFEAKNQLDTASVFAGLLTIILIGLFVENVIFRIVQDKTVRRWGMQN